MDPTHHLTFVAAYCAVRDVPTLTPELRRILMAEITERSDAETEQFLRQRAEASSGC
jgi:hypothetical protein